MAKQYNYCLDFFKGIACIFVVFMHCEFPGSFGIVVQTVSRFCVPLFFMISGYFCYKTDKLGICFDTVVEEGKCLIINKKIKHILRIVFWACLFYLCFVILQQLIFHNQSFHISKKSVLFFVIFNVPFVVAGQYWFLFALLYTYLFYFLLCRLKVGKFAYWLAGLQFLIYIALAQGAHIAGYHVPNCFYRNWLVEGFAFFMFGHWIHEHQDSINTSNTTLIWIIVLSTLACLLERYLLGRDFGVNICTIPQVFAMFVYAVKNPNDNAGYVQRLGRDCSMLIYILHPAVWHTLDKCYSFVGINGSPAALFLKPILVIVLSVFIAIAFNKVVGVLRNRNLSVFSCK